tara:strand:+ start:1948 stop:3351 length:1404 start_codon:yes stop_codon:yes gene_type:complete
MADEIRIGMGALPTREEVMGEGLEAERLANIALDVRQQRPILQEVRLPVFRDLEAMGELEDMRRRRFRPEISSATIKAVAAVGSAVVAKKVYDRYLKPEPYEPTERDQKLRQFYSTLASKAYGRDDDDVKLPEGVEPVPYEKFDDMAKVFKKDDKVFIAYKGTDTDNLSDLRADMSILFGTRRFDPKFKRALNLFDDVRKDFPTEQITVSGHSMGGGLGQHVAGNRMTHAYTFNAGAGPLQIGGTPLATNFITGTDSISKMVQFQKRGKSITHNPRDTGVVPFANLVERHGMKNFLPASSGGYNEDLDITNTDFLTLKDEELFRETKGLRRRPKKPSGKFRDLAVGDREFYFDAEELVRADLGLFDDDDEDVFISKETDNVSPDKNIQREDLVTKNIFVGKTRTKRFIPVNSIDKDNSGSVNLSELKNYLKDLYSNEEIEKIFKVLDKDNSGELSVEELQFITNYLN